MNFEKLLKFLVLFAVWLVTCAASDAAVSPAYTTDWVGNTSALNTVVNGWVGNCARSMWVA